MEKDRGLLPGNLLTSNAVPEIGEDWAEKYFH
jgi:hypothetical protein